MTLGFPSLNRLRTSARFTTAIAALGYFVDIYDLFLFAILRVRSLRDIGVPELALLDTGILLLNLQMFGMLLGGILWGVLGDRRGRVSVLFGSILLYSAANFANAYVHSVEAYAVLRFLAGLGLAGELGAAITLVAEVSTAESRGTATAWVAGLGLTGSAVAAVLADHMSWRACYRLGGILGFALLLSRLSILDSSVFRRMIARSSAPRGSLRLLFGQRARLFRYLSCIAPGLPIWFVGGILITFAPELGRARGLPGEIVPGHAILASYIGAAIGDVGAGLFSQWIRSRKRAITIFLVFLVLTIGTYLYLPVEWFGPRTLYWITLWMGIATGYWAVLVTTAAEQFGTNLRATVTTTVPNFVRGSVIPLTGIFNLFRHGMTLRSAAAATGAICIGLAFWGLRNLRESYGISLEYEET